MFHGRSSPVCFAQTYAFGQEDAFLKHRSNDREPHQEIQFYMDPSVPPSVPLSLTNGGRAQSTPAPRRGIFAVCACAALVFGLLSRCFSESAFSTRVRSRSLADLIFCFAASLALVSPRACAHAYLVLLPRRGASFSPRLRACKINVSRLRLTVAFCRLPTCSARRLGDVAQDQVDTAAQQRLDAYHQLRCAGLPCAAFAASLPSSRVLVVHLLPRLARFLTPTGCLRCACGGRPPSRRRRSRRCTAGR